jgi:thymidylate synthase
MKRDVLCQPFTSVGQWQSQSTEVKTRELMGVVLEYRLPNDPQFLADETLCNLPWAEDHFQERVSGEPLNPPPSEKWWPFNQEQNKAHKMQKDGEAQKFSHTYPERFWPKFANEGEVRPNGRQVFVPHNGIRFEYGDLWDLVQLLRRAPGTRQAYLPVWFPEDTGTVHGQRVPCTLGYHFMIRGGQLHAWYYMRSCDLLRHFPDDVYMAGRLVQWVCYQLGDIGSIYPGVLTMVISSLHVFETDDYLLSQQVS